MASQKKHNSFTALILSNGQNSKFRQRIQLAYEVIEYTKSRVPNVILRMSRDARNNILCRELHPLLSSLEVPE